MRPHGQLATVAVGLAAAIGLLLLIADTSYLRRRPLRPLRAAGAGTPVGASSASEPGTSSPPPALEYLQQAAAAQAPSYPAECDQQWHGLGYIQRLRRSMQPVCLPQEDASPRSVLLCSFQRDATYDPPRGLSEAFCAGANLALDLRKLQEYYDKPGARKFAPPGSLFGNCTAPLPSTGAPAVEALVAALRPAAPVLEQLELKAGGLPWAEGSFGHGGQKWLYKAFQNAKQGVEPVQCLAWLDHPLYFMADRYEPRNAWHAMEDVSHAFESCAMMGWGPDAHVVVLDPPGSQGAWEGYTYAPVWARAFSPQHAPTTLRELVRGAVEGHGGGELPPGAALCFREASWNVHGGVSLLSRGNGRPTPCTNSTTVNAMVAFVLDRLGLAAVRPASHTAAVLADSGSSGPGEGASGALLQPQQQLQEQQQQEQQRQRAAAAAQQMLRQKQLPPAAGPGAPPGSAGRVCQRLLWALRSNRATHQEGILRLLRQQLEERGGVELVAVDLGALGIEEQLRLVRSADVLAGYHGAALTLSLFMPPESALLEVEEAYRCHCYSNAAAWRNRPYYRVKTGPSPPNLHQTVARTARAALDLVAQRVAAVAAGVPLSEAPNEFVTFRA